MIDLLTELDLNILLFIQDNLRADGLTWFLKIITSAGSILLAVAAVAFVVLGSRERKLVGLTAFVSVGVDIALVNGVLKHIFARSRPFVTFDEVVPLMDVLSEYSFPSGHTALAFAMAFVFYRKLPKCYGVLALVVAGLVGFSRVYLGVHYLSDVVAGAFVGYVAAVIAEKLVDRFVRK